MNTNPGAPVNADHRIKLIIGDLVVRNAVLEAQAAELLAKMAEAETDRHAVPERDVP